VAVAQTAAQVQVVRVVVELVQLMAQTQQMEQSTRVQAVVVAHSLELLAQVARVW
jgi:hypothetical protein